MKIIDKLAWIEIKNRSILSTKSYGKDKFYIPGGKRELNETDIQALAREIKEELSVDLIEETIKLVGIFEAQADSHPQGVIVKMTCYTANYKGIIKENSEIETVKWLNYKNQNIISEVDQQIFSFLNEQNLLD